ncbi:hypothetical protein R1flu_006923 [Riccia fluitans]|uniref:SCP domain-containing protein n=1 Tax=Riccia fluitans TaxID=41844 RepID=A0ABD1YYH9_9MARC
MASSTITLLLLMMVMAMGREAEAQTWEQQFLDPQNAARRAVGVPSLTWDWTLARYAQNWANIRASRGNNCGLKHSYGPYGETLYWSSWRSTPWDACRFWLNEKAYYNYESNYCRPGKMCGHYTQIVWRTTTRVGCASASCPAGGTFTVCNFSPKGNYIGRRPY